MGREGFAGLDTGTHLVMGIGLAGLAHLDPAVASDSALAAAVLAGTVLGQQAPDFDTITRLKGNAFYIRHHRGMSHSMPAVLIWSMLITAGLALIFKPGGIDHLAFWVFAAVAVHVFSDLFNAYGTQSLRPLSKKWVAWYIIPIFDPVIFVLHLAAIGMWALDLARPGPLFAALYGILAVYYIWRTLEHKRLSAKLCKMDGTQRTDGEYLLIPTYHPFRWNVVKKMPGGGFRLGELKGGRLAWMDSVRCDRHPAIERSRQHPDIAAFLSFTTFVCAEVREHDWGYEVRWADVRARHRKNYPFVAVLLMDRQMNPLDSYVGWISESRMERRLGIGTTGG